MPLNRKRCDCGNKATHPNPDGGVCKRCAELEADRTGHSHRKTRNSKAQSRHENKGRSARLQEGVEESASWQIYPSTS